MIFVTVGVSKPFDRLIKKMDQLAASYREPIIMQTGCQGYKPRNARYFETLNHKDYLAYLQQADLVISHAGTGTTMDLILHQKRCILVPRMAKYGEHINDHQLEHVEGWGDKLSIKIVFDVNELDVLIHHIEDIPVPSPRKYTRDSLIQAIRDMMQIT
ncbi:MAG: hypothetical protein B5M56_03325 [Desulfococcus sp. 4484_241]|nr:MAG: hypothetical protein B5M56_03325 [Desulfococcus sp. 4484_241]